MNRILVTGGSGFIGSHLVEKLAALGYEVVCLVRPDSDLTWLEGLEVDYVVGDLTDPPSLAPAIQGADAVCHLAGQTRGRGFRAVNTAGTANLVRIIREQGAGPKRFVFVSSLAAQGPGSGEAPLVESGPDRPVSAYGRSKLAAEKALANLPRKVALTVLRPPVVYGPRDEKSLDLVKMIRQGFLPLVRGPVQMISLLYVADLVRALILALEGTDTTGKFLLSDGECRSVRELGTIIAGLLNTKVRSIPLPKVLLGAAALASEGWSRLSGAEPAFGWDKFLEMGRPNWSVDCALARERLGFSPRYKPGQGFRETLRWYEDHGWL